MRGKTKIHTLDSLFFGWGIILLVDCILLVSFGINLPLCILVKRYGWAEFDFTVPFLITTVILLCLAEAWAVWYRVTYFGHKGEYVKLQKKYVARKNSALKSSPSSYKGLPDFPFETPYKHAEKSFEKIQFISEDPLEADVDKALDVFRDGMPDLFIMRGDNHATTGDDAKVFLLVKEVAQSGGELAIIAVVFQKWRNMVSVDVRYSAWPNTIHLKTPRRRIYAETANGLCENWSSLKQ